MKKPRFGKEAGFGLNLPGGVRVSSPGAAPLGQGRGLQPYT